ncbi:alpha/beta hydrolase family protein, partial [Gemmatimonadota bacterium]
LRDGSETSFASVMDYRFTEDGGYMLYIVSSEEAPDTDGIYARRPGQAESQAVITGLGNYTRWTMNEDETHLIFLTDRDDYESKESTLNLYGWRVGEPAATLWVSHASTPGFTPGFSVSGLAGISLTDDGGIVSFGIKEVPEPEPEEEEAADEEEEEVAEFELWSWNDPYPYPQQLQVERRYRDRTFDAIYHVNSRRFVQLGDEEMWSVQLSDDGRIGFGQTDMPYRDRGSYDSSYYDFYLVDSMTGERTMIREESYSRGNLSPTAKYVTWWGTDRQWHLYDIATRETRNITRGLPVPVWRRTDDRPQPVGSYGMAGWTDDDATMLLYDEFDVWEVSPDGSTFRNITEGYGRANNLSFRYFTLDPDEEAISTTDQLFFNVTNTETMAHGVATDRVRGTREPNILMLADYSFGRPQKAEDTNAILTTRSTFYDFPDLYITNTSFREFTKVSDVGSQRDEFIWGKAELLSYINADGMEYKGMLIKPENFDPTRKYPMLVYIYEKLTNGLHNFRSPGPGTSINVSYYVSNGYLIWQPDIWYGTGHPGPDALDCVVSSVKRVIEEGFVDPERIGLQGHSWGGYQGAYMITQTDIFAAIESGAPVSNMTSAYGGIRWGSGMVRQFQYEKTQSRLGRTLWDGGMMRYIENSPVFYADRINTPVLILHNDQDDAVPWYQGIEFIMALRRLGKPAWMFNYNGEPHGLRQRVNQKDYTVRMQEFFDHYLKGAPMPDWMKNG